MTTASARSATRVFGYAGRSGTARPVIGMPLQLPTPTITV